MPCDLSFPKNLNVYERSALLSHKPRPRSVTKEKEGSRHTTLPTLITTSRLCKGLRLFNKRHIKGREGCASHTLVCTPHTPAPLHPAVKCCFCTAGLGSPEAVHVYQAPRDTHNTTKGTGTSL